MIVQKNSASEYKRAQRVKKTRSLEDTKKNAYWMYGLHSVAAALQNKKRRCYRLLATKEALVTLFATLKVALPKLALETAQRNALVSAYSISENTPNVEIVQRAKIDALFPQQSVHQSLALLCKPLESTSLAELLDKKNYRKREKNYILVLDRAQDPRNIGAVLRSAVFFGAKAVILANGHTPNENAVMAKAASGALEYIPILRLNLAQALRKLGGEARKKNRQRDEKQQKLASQTLANQTLANQSLADQSWLRIALEDASHKATPWGEQAERLKEVTNIVLVFGAENVGIRPLVRKQCDISLYLQNHRKDNAKDDAKIEDSYPSSSSIIEPVASLNLSNAVAATLALLAQQNKNDVERY